MIDLGLQSRNFTFECLRIVADHRIHDDRVDERHSDDPADKKQKRKVDLCCRAADPVFTGCRDRIGDLVPAFDREDPEYGVERTDRIFKIFRRSLAIERTRNERNDERNDKKSQNDDV